MSAFHKQGFKQRFHAMGDEAEAAFDLVMEGKVHKLGLNRPPFGMGGMNLRLRYTPDRLINKGLVECVGFGRDRILKFKKEKAVALDGWAEFAPTFLFVYDKTQQEYYMGAWEIWGPAFRTKGVDGEFHDGPKYHGLHVDDFPFDPKEVPL